MPGRLDANVTLITGAGTGIGEAIAHEFGREGAKLFLAGLPDDPVEDVARAISQSGTEVEVFLGDISDETTARSCVERAVVRFGKLDVLVNNAGVFLEVAECQNYSIEKFDETILNNIRSVFLMTKFALPHLQKSRGVVLSAGSEAGEMGEGNNAPYGGTKAFVHGFTRGIAYEQAKYGVRANCVCPGPIDTAWTHKETGPMNKEMEAATLAGTVLGRRGTPEEMANVYAFLASDEASFVTGALWFADGGTTIAKGAPGRQIPEALRTQPEPRLPLSHSFDGLRNKRPVNRLN